MPLTNSTNITNMILDDFKQQYSIAEIQIDNLYKQLTFSNPTMIYTKLKTILSRFYLIPNQMVNFNNYCNITKYTGDVNLAYNNDEYYYLNSIVVNRMYRV
jgi:hypothetical protein